MNAHTPNNGYFAPITSRLPGEDFEAFVARDWKARVVHERGETAPKPKTQRDENRNANRNASAAANAKARRENIISIIGAGEMDGRVIHRILCEQGPERNHASVRNYLAQMEVEGLLTHRLIREGTTRYAMWRVAK